MANKNCFFIRSAKLSKHMSSKNAINMITKHHCSKNTVVKNTNKTAGTGNKTKQKMLWRNICKSVQC